MTQDQRRAIIKTLLVGGLVFVAVLFLISNYSPLAVQTSGVPLSDLSSSLSFDASSSAIGDDQVIDLGEVELPLAEN